METCVVSLVRLCLTLPLLENSCSFIITDDDDTGIFLIKTAGQCSLLFWQIYIDFVPLIFVLKTSKHLWSSNENKWLHLLSNNIA